MKELLLVFGLTGSLLNAIGQTKDTLAPQKQDSEKMEYTVSGTVQAEVPPPYETIFGNKIYSADSVLALPVTNDLLIGKWKLTEGFGEYTTKYLYLEFTDGHRINIKHRDLNDTFVWSYSGNDIIHIYYLNTRNDLELVMDYRVKKLTPGTLIIDKKDEDDPSIRIGVLTKVK